MKLFFGFLCSVVCLSTFAARGVHLGDFSEANTDNDISIGVSSLTDTTNSTENISIGTLSSSKTKSVSSCVAIGHGALTHTKHLSGVVAIGNNEMMGEGYQSDTTSINGKQLWVSSPFDAFCINPKKENVITNTPLYYIDGTLHLNADSVVVDGKGGIVGNSVITAPKPPVVTLTEYPHQEYVVQNALTNGNFIMFGKWGSLDRYYDMKFTGRKCETRYTGTEDGNRVTSCGVNFSFEVGESMKVTPQATPQYYYLTNNFTISLPMTSGRFQEINDTIEIYSDSYYWLKANRSMSWYNGTITLTVGRFAGAVATNATLQKLSLTLPSTNEAFYCHYDIENEVDRMPSSTGKTRLVTSKGVADYAASKSELANVDARFDRAFATVDLDLRVGTTNLLRRVGITLSPEAMERVVATQEPSADGTYLMTEASGVYWYDFLYGNSYGKYWYETDGCDRDYYAVNCHLYALNLYWNMITRMTKTQSNGNYIYTLTTEFEVYDYPDYNSITSGTKTVTITNPRFKMSYGATYPVDSKASKGCLASAKSVHDSTFPVRYSDINPSSYSIGTMELKCYQSAYYHWEYPFGYYGRIETRATSIEDTFTKDGLVYPNVAYICFSNRTSELITGWHYNEFAITNGTTRTVPVSFYAGQITNINLTISYHTSPSVGITMTSSDWLWYGRTYKYTYSDNAPYFTTGFGTGVMDSSVSRSCVSSTEYVDYRLGGMSIKFEDGEIGVYTNGVKIGTLNLTQSP